MPVFAAYTKIDVSVTIKTNQVGFDRFTLYPSLYISVDNKTMSNKKLSGTYPSDSFGTPVMFTRPLNFQTSSTIQTKINIGFDDSNGGNVLFKFGVGKHEDGVFKGTTVLECSKCVFTYLFGLFPTDGYCLSFGTENNRIVVRNLLKLFLHFDRNGLIDVYIVNYYFGYTHRSFQFEPFQNLPPKLFVEKIDAKDIVISSTEKTNLMNMVKLFIGLFEIVLCFIF